MTDKAKEPRCASCLEYVETLATDYICANCEGVIMAKDKAKEQEQVYWCAWHPEEGYLSGYDSIFTMKSFDGAFDELKMAYWGEFDKHNCCPGDVRVNLGLDFGEWISSKGWKIKRLKLVDADSVVVPRAALETLQTYLECVDRPEGTAEEEHVLKMFAEILPRQEKEG